MTDLFSIANIEVEKPSGKELGRLGLKRAVDNAEAVHEGWLDEAVELTIEYMKLFGVGYVFKAEQARNYCESKGYRAPMSKRAFGAVPRRLAKLGMVVKVGLSSVGNARAHGANAGDWEIISLTPVGVKKAA